jgi:hypothetical protein
VTTPSCTQGRLPRKCGKEKKIRKPKRVDKAKIRMPLKTKLRLYVANSRNVAKTAKPGIIFIIR